jgi:hypothetical protein
MKKRLLLLLPCLLLSLLLVACGGGDDSSGGDSGSADAEAQIEDAITFSATSGDPSECTELSTPAFLEQRTNKTGAAAVKACKEEDESNEIADSVTVSNIEVDGDEATADTEFVGSTFDGQTLTIALVKDGDQWKLDRVTGFADLDKEALATTFEELFAAGAGDELGGEQIECFVEGVREADEQQIEEALLEDAPGLNAELQKKCSE